MRVMVASIAPRSGSGGSMVTGVRLSFVVDGQYDRTRRPVPSSAGSGPEADAACQHHGAGPGVGGDRDEHVETRARAVVGERQAAGGRLVVRALADQGAHRARDRSARATAAPAP